MINLDAGDPLIYFFYITIMKLFKIIGKISLYQHLFTTCMLTYTIDDLEKIFGNFSSLECLCIRNDNFIYFEGGSVYNYV